MRAWNRSLTGLCFALAAAGACKAEAESEDTGDDPEAAVDRLAGLPYMDATPIREADRGKSGVTQHDAERAVAGVGIYSTLAGTGAWMIDMDGSVVHEWKTPKLPHIWNLVKYAPPEYLYVLSRERVLAKLDWDSNVVWKLDEYVHHDLHFNPDGSLWGLSGAVIQVDVPGVPAKAPVLDNHLIRVSAEGEVVQRISIDAMVRDHVPASRLKRVARKAARMKYEHFVTPTHLGKAPPKTLKLTSNGPNDVYHINSVEVLDHDVAGLGKAGMILSTIREIDLVVLIDPENEKVVWKWGDDLGVSDKLDKPHHPTLVKDDHILLFDNGYERGWSRVIELDPATEEIVWQYTADPRESFYSPRRGGNQRFRNGNTMITESDRGRVFEITPEGDVVWEFFNPTIKNDKRGTIFRMQRFARSQAPRLAADSAAD